MLTMLMSMRKGDGDGDEDKMQKCLCVCVRTCVRVMGHEDRVMGKRGGGG